MSPGVIMLDHRPHAAMFQSENMSSKATSCLEMDMPNSLTHAPKPFSTVFQMNRCTFCRNLSRMAALKSPTICGRRSRMCVALASCRVAPCSMNPDLCGLGYLSFLRYEGVLPAEHSTWGLKAGLRRSSGENPRLPSTQHPSCASALRFSGRPQWHAQIVYGAIWPHSHNGS